MRQKITQYDLRRAFDVTEVIVWLRRAYPALAAVRVRQPALMSVAHEGVSPAVVRLKGYAAPESSGGIPLRDSRGEPSVGGGAADPHGALGCIATSGAVRTFLRLPNRPSLRRPSGLGSWRNVGPGVGGLKLPLGEVTCKSELQPVKT